MAWPFSGNSGGNKSADQALSEERLKILANVAIEQVPFPEPVSYTHLTLPTILLV